MLQETPQELFESERHGAALAVVSIVLPAEGDVGIGYLHQPMVRDGNAMGVAGQIVQYMFWPSERFFRIDDPVLVKQRA